MTRKERACAVVDLLKTDYPDAACALHYQHDYELLFATRLSAQCTDVRVNLVTEKLFVDFPTLESFAEAPLEAIEEGIKTCGLFRTKARDLKACARCCCTELRRQSAGQYGRSFETARHRPQDRQPDLGRHLWAARHRHRYPLHPAVQPAGLCRKCQGPGQGGKRAARDHPTEESSDFCHRLVLHGREVCTARAPKCEKCCLAAVCPSYPS